MLFTSSNIFAVEEREGILFLRITHNKVLYEEQIELMAAELTAAVRQSATKYCLDFTSLERFSSLGCGALLRFCHEAQGCEKRLAAHSLHPDVYHVLLITGIREYFVGLYDTEQQALEALGVPPRLPVA